MMRNHSMAEKLYKLFTYKKEDGTLETVKCMGFHYSPHFRSWIFKSIDSTGADVRIKKDEIEEWLK